MPRLLPVCVTLALASEVAGCQQAAAPALAGVRSWAYQLDAIDPRAIASSDFDLVVVDYARDGSDATALGPAQVAAMRRKRDGTPRVVLAYLSVGEAESHRYYWQPGWARQPPAWLGAEHPQSPGSYQVRFWDPGWQRLVFGRPDSYLDRIVRAGFDGVYLDVVDAYEAYAPTRPQAEREMVAFVRDLSRYAKSRRGGAFHVVAQNGEALVTHPEFVAAIDGLGKEELFYGYDGANAFTPAGETEFALGSLRRAKRAGKLVLTVDYSTDPSVVREVQRRSRAEGFVPYCTTRDLDRLTSDARPGASAPPRGSALERRTLPGRFFALTAPPGVVRTNLSVDAWRESPAGDAATSGGGEPSQEWTYALAVGYGLAPGWEVGGRIPVVSGRLAGTGRDGARRTGLGNVSLIASRGWSSHEGERNLLATFEAALPTDTRPPDFRPGTEARLSLTGERYRERIGVVGSLGVAYRAASDLTDLEAVLDASLGVGLQASERLYGSVQLSGERRTVRAEAGAELVLASGKSVELFVGRDVSGPAPATAVGVALNLWVDAARSRRRDR